MAVWLFEKKDIERWPRREKEVFGELLKRGISQLTRLRHPRLLVVEHTLEESRLGALLALVFSYLNLRKRLVLCEICRLLFDTLM